MVRASADRNMSVALLVGTRKGLFIVRSDAARGNWHVEGPHLAGYEIQRAFLDGRRPGSGFAVGEHSVWGKHVYRTDDAGRSWEPLREIPRHRHDETPASIRRLWSIAPGADAEPDTIHAGIEPPGLFVSRDRGESWTPLPAFSGHPTRATWAPAKGGLAVHSIQVDPRDPGRVFVALSAGGVYRTLDGGQSFAPVNAGVRAPYLPEREPVSGQCVHRILLHPADPLRLYQQSHCGTYRSDDGGDHWHEITTGLPSDFGYALASDPADPDSVLVIPERNSQFRATVDGRIRVYRSRDAGRSWTALEDGLPQANAYVTILRDGLDGDGLEPCGFYFGSSSGHLFGSNDGGDHWRVLCGYLPGILSVSAHALDPLA
ncbi:MAG: WD40/YVTN/BNR-like repeat-containing protein [Rhodanobacteraceae bacterium]